MLTLIYLCFLCITSSISINENVMQAIDQMFSTNDGFLSSEESHKSPIFNKHSDDMNNNNNNFDTNTNNNNNNNNNNNDFSKTPDMDMFSRLAMFGNNDNMNMNQNNDDNEEFNTNTDFDINTNNDNSMGDRSVECENRVYRKCVHVKYTEEDVENVRLYLESRFGKTGPVKPVCKKLYVRKDVKCLTGSELSELIDAFKLLYNKGIMDRYSLIHASNWPATHKFAEGIPWHRWHVLQIEKQLKKINPKLSMPYWESYSEFAAPEKSSIWDFLGTSGTQENNYCVTDGAFAYQTVQYPEPHCINRQWNRNGTMPPWEAPEWLTSATQTVQTWQQYVQMFGFTGHFKLHLSIGGFYGDYSIPWATNDPLFYIFHAFPTDLALLKWQLSDDNFLVPESFTGANRFDSKSRRIVRADVERDTFTYYTKTRVKEAFQMGFGDLCYIHDQLIRPINDIMKNIRRKEPVAMTRLRKAFSPMEFERYFPKYAAESANFFDHFLPDVGNCGQCKPIPMALQYNSTPNGLRQLERFRFDANIDTTPLVFEAETAYYGFMDQLRNLRYCSPYV